LEYDLKNLNPDVRRLSGLKNVAYDKKWLKTAPNFEVYYMYRGVKKKSNLRYDITIIPSRMLGQEFTKTKGHCHPKKFGEVYIVLEGKAFFLMQKCRNSHIEDIYAVRAKKGEVVVIPPKYGHITINPGKKILKTANWVSPKFKSIYGPIEKQGGTGYFFTTKGWIKNQNYRKVPKLRFEKPLKNLPRDLDFLKGE
jgi:glucose-6-phosphate isomerase